MKVTTSSMPGSFTSIFEEGAGTEQDVKGIVGADASTSQEVAWLFRRPVLAHQVRREGRLSVDRLEAFNNLFKLA